MARRCRQRFHFSITGRPSEYLKVTFHTESFEVLAMAETVFNRTAWLVNILGFIFINEIITRKAVLVNITTTTVYAEACP